MHTAPKLTFDFKVVIAGPFAAGKTTLIQASSDTPLVGTEAPTSGPESDVKAMTTVGMEYGTLTFEGSQFDAELRLYGVPGQERFSFMWDIMAVGMDGLFILVDASRPETWTESAAVARHFERIAQTPTIVGVNVRSGDSVDDLLPEIESTMALSNARLVPFNVMDRNEARDSLVELLIEILHHATQGQAA